ncbi:hypothetical protein HDU79_001240 [Rhizoclosmatium sp. JEL0117]|nr:hypothetical protein HDU79_001240 [Rhizoclosmatium sp. JEL0117]
MQPKRVVRSNLSSAGSSNGDSNKIPTRGLVQIAPELDKPMVPTTPYLISSASEPQTLCGTPAGKETADESVVFDILKRQENWEAERAELDVYLQQVKDMVSTGNSTLISNQFDILDHHEQILMERNKNETAETRAKLLDGFRKIKLLDSILQEKTLLADSMSSKPSTTSNMTLTNTSKPQTAFENTIDDDNASISGASSVNDFELKSVHSLDTRTFLTEPKLQRKLGGTRRSAGTLRSSQHHGSLPSSQQQQPQELGPDGQPIPEKKGYKLGDFIQRNIVLGPQARYYHAMTEVEQDRVEKLLMESDEFGDDVEGEEDGTDGFESIQGSSERREGPDEMSSTASRRTYLSSAKSVKNTWLELDRLAKIDKELMAMHGNDVEIASLVWTPSVWTPTASGISTPMYPPSSARDVKSVMDLHDLHEQDSHLSFDSSASRIEKIDEQLRKFHERRIQNDDELESQERIEELLEQIRASHGLVEVL